MSRQMGHLAHLGQPSWMRSRSPLGGPCMQESTNGASICWIVNVRWLSGLSPLAKSFSNVAYLETEASFSIVIWKLAGA